MTVDYNTFKNDKIKFFKKHGGNWKLTTSLQNEYGVWHKTYSWSSPSATWEEVMTPITETVEIEKYGCKFNFEVKFLRTEYFNTDNSKSRYYYEKY